ncbi:unnamed protein product [Pleuronectes platessa]|uniref:Uncharacterized protein n=1 Tax=Pleuronectes platessa TaxID=8262 RepID=A0A9N7ZAI2_PLEPL|nr:unnamed protein product [Pleuronectes platessa]
MASIVQRRIFYSLRVTSASIEDLEKEADTEGRRRIEKPARERERKMEAIRRAVREGGEIEMEGKVCRGTEMQSEGERRKNERERGKEPPPSTSSPPPPLGCCRF